MGTPNRIQYHAIEVHWPRRLLYIPALVSYEREGANIYNGVTAPVYNIITYTWGRFQAPDGGPALPITGITWKIPPIQETCFTVDAFQHVLKQIGKKFDWVWLDVACIDQKNEKVKMDEVGRQVPIFQGATKVYAWLHGLPTLATGNHIEKLGAIVARLNFSGRHDFDSDESDDDREQDMAQLVPYMHSQLEPLLESLEYIFQDPWFTSLWTLQEAILRRDAFLLGHDGLPIIDGAHGKHITISTLNNWCHSISRFMQTRLEAGVFRAVAEPKVRKAISLIEKVGFNFTDATNPNVQYGAAKFRETSHPQDRIHGIFGIYRMLIPENMRLPTSTEISLDQLEDCFALMLNSVSPLIGQCFVHLSIPPSGKTWRIAQSITVPDQFRGINATGKDTVISSIFQEQSGRTRIQGKACPLQVLYEYWSTMRTRGTTFMGTKTKYTLAIAYDKTLSTLIPAVYWAHVVEWANPGIPEEEHDFRVTQTLMNQIGPSNLYVVHLGYQGGAPLNTSFQPSELCPRISHMLVSEALKSNVRIVLQQENMAWVLKQESGPEVRKHSLGMIVYKGEDGCWRRIGICTWDDNNGVDHDLRDWTSEID